MNDNNGIGVISIDDPSSATLFGRSVFGLYSSLATDIYMPVTAEGEPKSGVRRLTRAQAWDLLVRWINLFACNRELWWVSRSANFAICAAARLVICRTLIDRINLPIYYDSVEDLPKLYGEVLSIDSV